MPGRSFLLSASVVLLLGACAGPRLQPRVEMLERRPDQWSSTIAGEAVVTFCSPSLRTEVEALFSHLRELSRQGVVFAPGSRVPYRWTTLEVRQGPGRLELWEPDYERDPEGAYNPGVDVSLRVAHEQQRVLQLAEVNGLDVQFDQHVLVATESWRRDDLMLARVDSPGGRLTGWRIVPSDVEQGLGDVESVPLYEVYRRRPELLGAMRLPPGYLAFFEGGSIVAIVDPGDAVVWAAPTPMTPGG